MNDPHDHPLLLRYITDECSAAERAEVEAWMAAVPDRAAYVASLRALHDNLADQRPTADSRGAWLRMRERLAEPRRASESDQPHRESNPSADPRRTGSAAAIGGSGQTGGPAMPRTTQAMGGAHPRPILSRPKTGGGTPRRLWPGRVGADAPRPSARRVVGIAAGIAILAAGTLGVWRAGWLTPAQQFREFASAPGSRTTITLRDGTRLVLGPDTHVRVPRDFGARTRMVELSGEAQFAVVHDTRRPFAVRTQRAITRDVGTTFVVRAYDGDAADRVAVQEGEVALSCDDRPARDRAIAGTMRCAMTGPVRLAAGDLAAVSGGAFTVALGARLDVLTAWLQGGLVFEDTPLREAVREIARQYGVGIVLADTTLGMLPVTASFTDRPLDVVLEAVTRAVGARYERTARGVVIWRDASSTRDRRRGPAAPLTTAARTTTD